MRKGVVDVQYMDGRIERTLKNGKKYTIVEGEQADLVQEVETLQTQVKNLSKRNPFDFVKSVSYDKKDLMVDEVEEKHINHS